MIIANKALLTDINALIIEKLNAYPNDVRELAIQAIRLSSESYTEGAIADLLQPVVRRLAKQQEGDGR